MSPTAPPPDPAAFARTVQAHFPGAVVTRLVLTLDSQHKRAVARRAIDKAPPGYVVDIHEERRNDAQNRALWPRLTEIQRQRPTHNNVPMTPELWKCVFMDALGMETTHLPKLDGKGFFPLGHSSSALTKSQFADLLTLIDAYCAQQGIALKHFDGQGSGMGTTLPEKAA